MPKALLLPWKYHIRQKALSGKLLLSSRNIESDPLQCRVLLPCQGWSSKALPAWALLPSTITSTQGVCWRVLLSIFWQFSYETMPCRKLLSRQIITASEMPGGSLLSANVEKAKAMHETGLHTQQRFEVNGPPAYLADRNLQRRILLSSWSNDGDIMRAWLLLPGWINHDDSVRGWLRMRRRIRKNESVPCRNVLPSPN
jgi:hypothetical protein